jgi:predicted RNA-binding Zn-ribbon protein involved in translation (DUF1610 family)
LSSLETSETKRCPKCGEVKPREAFQRHKNRKDGLQSACKACKSDHSRQKWAGKSDEERKLIGKQNYKVRDSRSDISRWMKFRDHRKQNGCASCGFLEAYSMESDHVDGKTKSFTISKFLSQGNSRYEELEEELSKTQPLCRNCHALKTAMEHNHYTYNIYLYEKRFGRIPADISLEEFKKIIHN